MNISVQIIKSFSINGTGGNAAGVVLNADDLTTEQKQAIALKAGLSETAFVSKSSLADFKLDFFTPARQIAHCGHATIATFWYLKSLNKINGNESSKETIDGTRKIFFKGDKPFMEQRSPTFTLVSDSDSVLRSLGINATFGKRDFPPIIGNTGNSFVLVRVNEFSDLSRLTPDLDLISKISLEHNCIGYYIYVVSGDHSEIQTRMFAPYYGIDEESATGMAAGPLAAFLYPELKRSTFSINQGKYMTIPSESKLNVVLETDSDAVKSVLVGGGAFVEKTIEITL